MERRRQKRADRRKIATPHRAPLPKDRGRQGPVTVAASSGVSGDHFFYGFLQKIIHGDDSFYYFIYMDIWDKEKRSEVMSKIRSKDTKPEMTLRKALFARGFRYRLNDKRLPGKPDIVLPKYKTVIFIHGCFWHKHDGCKYAYTPKTNTEFWVNKITGNRKRDKINTQRLVALGWNVLTVWECEIRHKYKHDITPLIDNISEALFAQISPQLVVRPYGKIRNEILMVAESAAEYRQAPKA